MARRWGAWPTKAAMWADQLACTSCGAEAGQPCLTRSRREADSPHGPRELRPEARPPQRPAREQLDAVGRWHRRSTEAMARRQTEERKRARPMLRQEMSVPRWNPFPSRG